MKHSLITSVLFLSFCLFAQDSSTVYDQKLNQLRSELGISADADFGNSGVYNKLVNRLDSLGIEDEQLEDGYEWGGGKIGFEAYLKNNIDRLLADFRLAPIPSDSLKKEKIDLLADKQAEVQKDLKEIEQEVEPVKDLVVVKTSTKKDKKRKKKKGTSGKSMLTGLRIGSGLGKPLAKEASLSDHASYFEPGLSIRTPLGIGIGPVYTSLGYESSKYSFEAPADTIASYFGSGAGPTLFFDLGKIIKIGGENLDKYFILGISTYDHGSGFIGGYDLNMSLGSLPVSLSVSSRMNIVSFDTGGTTYWVSASAGLGYDIR